MSCLREKQVTRMVFFGDSRAQGIAHGVKNSAGILKNVSAECYCLGPVPAMNNFRPPANYSYDSLKKFQCVRQDLKGRLTRTKIQDAKESSGVPETALLHTHPEHILRRLRHGEGLHSVDGILPDSEAG